VQERKLRTVPVVNYELIAAQVADMPVYKVQTFSLNAWGSMGGDGQHTTACTPAVIITGSPESIVDPNDANDQRALFNKIKAAPDAAAETQVLAATAATQALGPATTEFDPRPQL